MEYRIVLTQRRLGVVTEKPDQTSIATNMHVILFDKNNVNFSKETQKKRQVECKYFFKA
jgi:hypothetical protein